MARVLDPFQSLIVAVSGWMNQRQWHAIEYLREENRVFREQLGGRRIRFNDDEQVCWLPKRRWLIRAER